VTVSRFRCVGKLASDAAITFLALILRCDNCGKTDITIEGKEGKANQSSLIFGWKVRANLDGAFVLCPACDRHFVSLLKENEQHVTAKRK